MDALNKDLSDRCRPSEYGNLLAVSFHDDGQDRTKGQLRDERLFQPELLPAITVNLQGDPLPGLLHPEIAVDGRHGLRPDHKIKDRMVSADIDLVFIIGIAFGMMAGRDRGMVGQHIILRCCGRIVRHGI